MGPGIERGSRDRPAKIADINRLEAGLGRDHRQDRKAGKAGEAVGEIILGPEHHARPDDGRLREGGAHCLLAERLGPAIVGLAVGVGADRADMDEGLGARRLGRRRQFAGAFDMHPVEIALENADQVDDGIRPFDRGAIVAGRCRSAATAEKWPIEPSG